MLLSVVVVVEEAVRLRRERVGGRGDNYMAVVAVVVAVGGVEQRADR